MLNFSAFDLEASGGCTYDYLKIYDGNGTVSPADWYLVRNRFTGKHHSHPLQEAR